MNDNTEYEKFAQKIYQSLVDAQGLTIDVQHNIKIKGKAFKHQIDVYWEYENASKKHKVAIECKNYNSVISVGKVRDFFGVLYDIGNINGYIVTKKGYQKGAKEFAEYYGINLMILREPQEEDWKGRIKTIAINIQLITHNVTDRFTAIDPEWAKVNYNENELKNLKLQISGMSDEIWIIDSNDNKIKNFQQLEDELPNDSKRTEGLNHTYTFDDGYIKSNDVGKIKIKGIQFTYDINVGNNKLIIDAQDTAKAILKDALSGEIKFFDKNGNVK